MTNRCEGRSLLTDYVWEGTLGAGAFGRVSKCRNRHDGSLRAIKIIMPPGGLVGAGFQDAMAETKLQQKLAVTEEICKIFSWGAFSGALTTLSSLFMSHGE